MRAEGLELSLAGITHTERNKPGCGQPGHIRGQGNREKNGAGGQP